MSLAPTVVLSFEDMPMSPDAVLISPYPSTGGRLA
jgi:hypothetical protein